MPTFPPLTYKPEPIAVNGEIAIDPTMRSNTEGGYVVTRARFTRATRKWVIKVLTLPDSDIATLKAFELTVGVGSVSFTWVHPVDGVSHTVRLMAPIKYPQTRPDDNDVEYAVEEV